MCATSAVPLVSALSQRLTQVSSDLFSTKKKKKTWKTELVTQLLDLAPLTTQKIRSGLVGFSTAGKLRWMTLCGLLGLRIRWHTLLGIDGGF